MTGWEIFQLWVMAFATISIFSFLYGDNPLFKFAEHLFAGLTAGYYFGLYYDTVIVQQLWIPISENLKLSLILPGIFGILMFSRLVPKYSWLARIGLAFVMGSTAGIFIMSELHGNVLGQMGGAMAIQTSGGAPDYLLTAIAAIGLICTLIYFYFSKEHTGVLGATANVGIWFIMISFGAHFGYTVMGRISLLIGRSYFLWTDWIGSFKELF